MLNQHIATHARLQLRVRESVVQLKRPRIFHPLGTESCTFQRAKPNWSYVILSSRKKSKLPTGTQCPLCDIALIKTVGEYQYGDVACFLLQRQASFLDTGATVQNRTQVHLSKTLHLFSSQLQCECDYYLANVTFFQPDMPHYLVQAGAWLCNDSAVSDRGLRLNAHTLVRFCMYVGWVALHQAISSQQQHLLVMF